MGEVNAQLLTEEISTLTDRQLEEVMHFVGYLKSIGNQASSSMTLEVERQKVITEALSVLCSEGTFSDIQDPVAWQREIREDRVLLGRTS